MKLSFMAFGVEFVSDCSMARFMSQMRVGLLGLVGLGVLGVSCSMGAVSVSEVADGRLQIVITAPGVDAAHTRVMMDIDENLGTGFGDEGADLMIEGATLYQYPAGASGWSWNSLGPVSHSTDNDQLTYTLSVSPEARILRVYVENFDDNWEVTGRYPAEGAISVDMTDIPKAQSEGGRDEGALSGKLYRTPSGGLAVVVLGQSLDPGRLRVFINTDESTATGMAPMGADYLIEGFVLYQYSGSGTDWSWTPLRQLTPETREGGILYPLDGLNDGNTIEYLIEKTNTDWEVIDRYPQEGTRKIKRSDLKEYSYQGPDRQVGPKNYHMEELRAFVPPSLNAGFDERMAEMDWQEVPLTQAQWEADGFSGPLPLVFNLEDAETGEVLVLEPDQLLTSGEWTQWLGEADGVRWRVIGHEDERGDMDLYAQLKSDKERLLRLGVGVKMPLEGWVWHDDVEYRRPIEDEEVYAYTGSSPYGLDGAVSKYPLGVISDENRSLILETDLSEPVVFNIAALPQEDMFAIYYDVALTALTRKFPGEAVLHLSLRARTSQEQQAFRLALDELYGRYPSLFERRPDAVGLWMPFTDISNIPDPQDFGFAYYEKGGALGSDVDFCHENGVLTLVYTEPWLYWLPMPQGMERTPESALGLMRSLSASGAGRAGEFASAGLLGAARSVDGDIVMTFQDVPWNSGARMEVSTDPELPTRDGATVNRAMAEFAFMREQMEHEKVDGIYLDSLSAMFTMDYNPAALAVADYPATFTADVLKPGLATPVAAYEFIAALSGYARQEGKYLMGNFPCWNFPFFMPLIDIPGEETHWFGKGRYERMPDREMNYRRAMSGQKAWGFLMNGKYDHFDPEFARRYFEDCLFWAFQPSLFSHDAANDPYWENPEWYERDRPFFRRYMPWIQRLAAVGWRPQGSAVVSDEEIQVEHFYGDRDPVQFVTVRNSSQTPISTYLEVPLAGEDAQWVWMNPLDGEAGWIFTDASGMGTVPVSLEPDEVRLLALMPSREIASEIVFLKDWEDGKGDAGRLIDKLASLQDEQEAGLLMGVEVSQPALRGVENDIWVGVKNVTPSVLTLAHLRLVPADGEALELLDEPVEIAPVQMLGIPVEVSAGFGQGGGFSLDADFTVDGGGEHRLSQPVTWTLRDPVAISLSDPHVISIQERASIPLRVRNLMDAPATITFTWDGDYGEGESEVTLKAKEERRVYLPVVSGGRPEGAVTVRAESRGVDLFKSVATVTFLGAHASVVRDSSVALSTSGDFPGYTSQTLRDGVTRPGAEMAFNEAAWASEDVPGDTWVRFDFPSPVEVSEVKLYWNEEGGVRYTSQSGVVEGVREDGSTWPLQSYTSEQGAAVTTVSFDAARVAGLVIRQPDSQGPVSRPNILWLNEIEVR